MLCGAKTSFQTSGSPQESDSWELCVFRSLSHRLLNGLFNGLLLFGKWDGIFLHKSGGVMSSSHPAQKGMCSPVIRIETRTGDFL